MASIVALYRPIVADQRRKNRDTRFAARGLADTQRVQRTLHFGSGRHCMGMRRLILLRHAKSDRGNPSLPDLARPLNQRGQDAATRIGAYMAKHELLPDFGICSIAERTRQTWELVAQAFAKPCAVTFEKRLYNADDDKILAVIQETPAEVHTVMVVGHNPGMQDIALSLLAAGNIDQRANLLQKFPTGGLVVIDFAVDDWASVHARSGRLDRFITPRRLTSDTA